MTMEAKKKTNKVVRGVNFNQGQNKMEAKCTDDDDNDKNNDGVLTSIVYNVCISIA